MSGGLKIPDLASWLSDPSMGPDTVVTGLDSVPAEDRPTRAAVNIVHLAWDTMVGLGTALTLLALWFAVLWWRRRAEIVNSTWLLRAAVIAPIAAYLCLEAGWVVTEVGRQPWIVYEILRTEDAVTNASASLVWTSFTTILVLYALLATGCVLVIRAMTRRWRDGAIDEDAVPYGPREEPPAPETGASAP